MTGYFELLDKLKTHFDADVIVNTVTQGGVAGATNDFRAPIFYDSNNTGYYVDGNNTPFRSY